MASKVRFILTCDGDCPTLITSTDIDDFARIGCPQDCPMSYYEREYLNTELPEDEG